MLLPSQANWYTYIVHCMSAWSVHNKDDFVIVAWELLFSDPNVSEAGHHGSGFSIQR